MTHKDACRQYARIGSLLTQLYKPECGGTAQTKTPAGGRGLKEGLTMLTKTVSEPATTSNNVLLSAMCPRSSHDDLARTIRGMLLKSLDGEIPVAPGIASRVLTESNWEGQRSVASWHVDLLAQIMRRGEWKDGSQIAFCELDGRLHLVNGQHRMEAVVKAGKVQRFQVKIHVCQSRDEVAQHYWSYDVAARKRSNAQVLTAANFAEAHGLGRTISEKLYGCTPLLSADFARVDYRTATATSGDAGQRIAIASLWVKEAGIYQQIVQEAYSHRHKTRLVGAAVMAIALYTIRHNPAKAVPFWSGVATGEGLKRGDPRKALISDFDNRPASGGDPDRRLLPVATAWNAWVHGRDQTIIKIVNNATFSLAGTPLAKGRK